MMVIIERWAPIPGYEGFYDASTQGRIRNIRGGRVLKSLPMSSGYTKVNLSREGKVRTEYVHQLVAKTFLGPRPSTGHDVCHGEGGPADNRVGNIRWDTKSENVKDTVRHGNNVKANRVQCPLGHRLEEPNLVTGHPTRKCLACARARSFAQKRGLPLTKELGDSYYEQIMLAFNPRVD